LSRSILHAALYATSPLAIAASAMLLACGSVQATDTTPPVETDDGLSYWPSADWRRARPQDVDLDPARITTLISRLRANQPAGIHSLVLVRHGYLVTEEYFNGSSATVVHTMQSVSKSVTSLLVGIAAERNALPVTRAVVEFFPEYANLQHLDGRKRALTAQHLLEMRTGMDFWENPYPGSPLQQLNDSRDDWVRFVLDRPMLAAPGTTWAYNSGGVIALAGVLRAVTGERPDAFARRVLFDPIGVRSPRWYTSPFDALPHTGGGLNLTAVDLARVGYLVLRNGRWGDEQIVSADWLRESLRPITRSTAGWGGRAFDYGRLWWMTALDGSGATEDPQRVVWTAAGSGGQFLFVIPRHDLVVAVTASAADFASPVRFLFDDIIAGVQ
jgi:CubicO group peptidase (beta-lactamase class C family)